MGGGSVRNRRAEGEHLGLQRGGGPRRAFEKLGFEVGGRPVATPVRSDRARSSASANRLRRRGCRQRAVGSTPPASSLVALHRLVVVAGYVRAPLDVRTHRHIPAPVARGADEAIEARAGDGALIRRAAHAPVDAGATRHAARRGRLSLEPSARTRNVQDVPCLKYAGRSEAAAGPDRVAGPWARVDVIHSYRGRAIGRRVHARHDRNMLARISAAHRHVNADVSHQRIERRDIDLAWDIARFR